MPNKPHYPTHMKPFIVHIGVDGVTLTGSSPELQSHLPEYILRGVEQKKFQSEFAKLRYYYAARVRIGANPNGGVVLYCRGNGQWMVRWNPSYMSIKDDIRVREVLKEYLKQEFDELWKRECISRCDLAIDIAHLTPDMVICKRKRSRKFQCVASGSGDIETIYFGEDPPTTVLYNKRLQLEAKKLAKMRGNCGIEHDILTPLKFDLTRIEERQFQLEPCSLVKKPYNPLDRLDVYWHPELYSCNTIPELFLDSCRLRGLNNALKLVSDTQSKFLLGEVSRHKNILSQLDAADDQIRKAYKRLMVMAPQKLWKSHLEDVAEPLRNYIHTGYITNHLIKLAFGSVPTLNQCHKLSEMGLNYSGKKFWHYDLLGHPITYADAIQLILLNEDAG